MAPGAYFFAAIFHPGRQLNETNNCSYTRLCSVYQFRLLLHKLSSSFMLSVNSDDSLQHTKHMLYVTVSVKTILIGTFSILRNADLKYCNCCGSVLLAYSHDRFTV